MTSFIYHDNLQTDRLVTRKLTENDISIWTAFFEDKDAIEFMPPTHLTTPEKKAELWIKRQLARYAENRYGLQVLIEKKTNNFVGQAGILIQEVDGIKEIEVGYHIFKKYWGQGFAPEAAKMFINYAFENNLTNSVISIIDTRNTKSQRVAKKNGLVIDKKTRWSNLDVYIYRINKLG